MSDPRVVYSTTSPRERGPSLSCQPKGTMPNVNKREYIVSMYDEDTLSAMRQRIEWLRALCAERWEFVRLDMAMQDRVNAWWTRRVAAATRFEGGADTAAIQESLTQQRYALESDLSAREARR